MDSLRVFQDSVYAAEEARRIAAEEEARRTAAEEARQRAAEEARQRAEEEARQRAEEEARQREAARRLTIAAIDSVFAVDEYQRQLYRYAARGSTEEIPLGPLLDDLFAGLQRIRDFVLGGRGNGWLGLASDPEVALLLRRNGVELPSTTPAWRAEPVGAPALYEWVGPEGPMCRIRVEFEDRGRRCYACSLDSGMTRAIACPSIR